MDGKEDMLETYREMNVKASKKFGATYIDVRKVLLEATEGKGLGVDFGSVLRFFIAMMHYTLSCDVHHGALLCIVIYYRGLVELHCAAVNSIAVSSAVLRGCSSARP